MAAQSGNVDVEAGAGFLTKETGKKEKESMVFNPNKSDSFFESKLFRLITVMLYVSMVSGMGLMLSVYHLVIWDSKMPPVAQIPGHEIY